MSSGNIISTLKVRFTSDTGKLKKDMYQSKKAMKDFKKEGGNALNQLSHMLGVDIGRMSDSLSMFSKSTKAMGSSFRVAAAGSGGLSAALKILKVALVSTGIGAIVVALGSLIAYFTGSQRGADKLSVWLKKLGAVVDVIKDRLVQFGEGIMLLFEGKWGEAADKMKNSFKGIGKEIAEEAKQAGELEKRDQALQDREIELITVLGNRKRKIEELRKAAEEEKYTAKERAAMLKEAMNLTKQNVKDEVALQKERVAIMKERLAMGESSRQDRREFAEAQDKLNALVAAGDKQLKRIITRYNALTHEVQAATAAMLKLDKAQSKYLKNAMEGFKLPEVDVSGLAKSLKPVSNLFNGVMEETQKGFIDLTAILKGTIATTAAGFGALLGDMMLGVSGVKDMGAFLFNAIASLMEQLGQAAIQIGTTLLAITTSMISLNPFVAIAAGVALIALARVIKGTIGNIAKTASSGGSAAAATVTVPRTSLADTNYSAVNTCAQRTETIRIVGTLTGKGSDLVAVIDKEADRKYITT